MSISPILCILNEFIPRIVKRESIVFSTLTTSTMIKSNRSYEEQIWIPMHVLGKEFWSYEDI